MENLTKISTSYKVQKQGRTVEAVGELTVNSENQVMSMFLTFYVEDQSVGSVSYSEYAETSNYSYSIQSTEHKSEIMEVTGAVLQELKSELTE